MYAFPQLNWGSCEGISDNEYQCAKMTVPLDYSNSHPGNTWIEVIKYQKAGTNPDKFLFVGSDGPWVPMTSVLPILVQSFENQNTQLTNQFTIISFDPRGVGQSQNLNCNTPLGNNITDINFASAEGMQEGLKIYGQIGQLCDSQFNNFQHYMGTTYTAKDMDQIRQALGISQISYFAYSYGTQLGSLYLSLYPTHVRAMVLDSNISPVRDYQSNVIQIAESHENTLEAFFSYCDENAQCPLYPNAAKAYHEAESIVNTSPIPAGPNQSPLTINQFYIGIGLSALQNTSSDPNSFAANQWNVLAEGLKDINTKHDGTKIKSLFLQVATSMNNDYVTPAVMCADSGNLPSASQSLQIASSLRQKNHGVRSLHWRIISLILSSFS